MFEHKAGARGAIKYPILSIPWKKDKHADTNVEQNTKRNCFWQ